MSIIVTFGNIKLFVGLTYFLSVGILVYLFFNNLGLNLFSFLLLIFALSLFYQIKKFNKNKPEDCLYAFKINNFSGLLLFLGIYSI